MSKRELIQAIIQQLTQEWEATTQAAKDAFEYATDAESKSEGKYDTRGLEASYLARGQALRVAEIEEARTSYAAMSPRDFAPGESIALGALVYLRCHGEISGYFIGPKAGGTELRWEGKDILILTPSSPLGKALLGRRQGDRLQVKIVRASSEHEIVSVC